MSNEAVILIGALALTALLAAATFIPAIINSVS